jgi:MoaA/NifB/PqqE/SkfB family radical SAM enzyme
MNSRPITLEFFDRLPTLKAAVTAAGLFAEQISPKYHGRPFTMMLAVTRRCNSRCTMCHIWEEKLSPMLTLDQYRQMFREPLPSVRALVLTGGEPTLRQDLPTIWDIARSALPSLEYGLLATSGLNVQRTLAHVEAIMQQIERAPGRMTRFDVQVSLDGIGDMHDTIRGIPGYFKRVQATLDGLAALQQRYSMLHRRLSCVVMPQNLDHVTQVQDLAAAADMPVHFSPLVFSSAYYRNLEDMETLGFVPGSVPSRQAQQTFHDLHDCEGSSLRFYYHDVANMLGGAERSRTCLMGFFGCVVEHTGEVYPCINWEHESFGNLLEQSFDEIWFGSAAQEARYNLRRTGCPTCPSMCYPHAVGVGEVAQEKLGVVQRRLKRVAGRIRKKR